ncbi:MAG: DUF2442 domain-containing protein, partial [Cyanobacteriota bacterium]|nr:DUF2442 domain-containing protein [Cyanobacteriota bacterium]
MKIPKIQSVIPTEKYLLLVTFSDGTKKIYDASRLLHLEMFTCLKNEAFFRNVSVEPGGYAISWNSEIDISEFELW